MLSPPIILAILNLTPDSFSDGGDLPSLDLQLRRAESLLQDGAHVIDIGAESTRPASASISVEEEWHRLYPLITRLHKNYPGISMSIDTQKLEIARRAADSGVEWVNMIGQIPSVHDAKDLRQRGVKNFICMHVYGTPQTMQDYPLNSSQVISAVDQYFEQISTILTKVGFEKTQQFFDPGIGFGKTDGANLKLLKETKNWSNSRQIALGVSRKSLIGRTLDIAIPKDRDDASKMLELGLVMLGASLIRTHSPKKLSHILSLLYNEEIPC